MTRAHKKLPVDFAGFVAANPTLTQAEVAKMFSCSRAAVCKEAQRAGVKLARKRKAATLSRAERIERNRKLPKSEEFKALVAANPDLTAAELCAQYGVTRQAVSLLAAQCGIKLKRSPHKRKAYRGVRFNAEQAGLAHGAISNAVGAITGLAAFVRMIPQPSDQHEELQKLLRRVEANLGWVQLAFSTGNPSLAEHVYFPAAPQNETSNAH
jgi:hypothetical protein